MSEKVLLIDDDLDTLRLVGLMLQRQGYQILSASNGPQALIIAEKELPDIILLDVMMPEMDGYEVARRIRSNPRTKSIPIIMFTAKNQVEDKLIGFEAGADDYITKPTQPRELFAHMKAVLSRVQKTETASLPPVEKSTERGLLIGVVGAKGGVGVSTITINLGLALRKISEKETIISDFVSGAGTIALELGFPKSDGVAKILHQQANEITTFDIERNLISYSPGIKLFLSSHTPAERYHSGTPTHYQLMTQILIHLAQITIIDMGSSINPLYQLVYPICDLLLMIFEPTQTSITMGKELIEEFSTLGIPQNRILPILNNRSRSDIMLTRTQVQEMLGREFPIMFTPAPELIHHASLNKKPLFTHQPESVIVQQFSELARHVLSLF